MKMIKLYIENIDDYIELPECMLDYIEKNFIGRTFDEKFSNCLRKALDKYKEKEKLDDNFDEEKFSKSFDNLLENESYNKMEQNLFKKD